MVGDLLVLIRSNRSHLLQIAERLDLGGLVVVAVVGADSNIILSRIPENVIHVVIRLAGNILPVFLHRVLRQFLSLGRPAALQIFYYVRYPLGGRLGPVEPELAEKLWHFAHDHRVKCADDGNTKLPEATSAVVLRHQVDDLRVAVADVYSHRQVEPAYLLVEGIKIGIGDQPAPFDAAHENTAGSMLLAKLEFLQRRAHIQQGQDTNPSEPPLPLPVNVGEPAVVALGDGDFPLDFVGYLLDKNRRIKHLNVDTQLVHVFEPGRYVFHLSGFPRRFHRTARARRNVGELASGHHDPHQATYFPVDEPVLSTALTARAHNQRTIFLVRPLHEIPGVFRLDNVSIRINGRHY